MAVYIHSKMEAINQKGHREYEKVGQRTSRSSRNGGRYFVRSVCGLRTRLRLSSEEITAERLFKANLPFGGSLGTSYAGGTVGRTNKSVGNKDAIRLWY